MRGCLRLIATLLLVSAFLAGCDRKPTSGSPATAPTGAAPPSSKTSPDQAPPPPPIVGEPVDPPLVIARPTLGSSVVRVPSTMKQGREVVAQLIVAPTDLASLLAQSAVTHGDADVRDSREKVRLMPRMRASLLAPGFTLTPTDAVEQVVKVDEPTVWTWALVPADSGSRTLVFTLEGLLTVDGKETALRPPALTVPVQVEIDPMLFFEKYWQWLMTAIVIPLAVFFVKHILERRSRSGSSA